MYIFNSFLFQFHCKLPHEATRRDGPIWSAGLDAVSTHRSVWSFLVTSLVPGLDVAQSVCPVCSNFEGFGFWPARFGRPILGPPIRVSGLLTLLIDGHGAVTPLRRPLRKTSKLEDIPNRYVIHPESRPKILVAARANKSNQTKRNIPRCNVGAVKTLNV